MLLYEYENFIYKKLVHNDSFPTAAFSRYRIYESLEQFQYKYHLKRNKVVSRKSINNKQKKGRIVQFFNFHIDQTLLIRSINAIINNKHMFDCDILLAKLEVV